MTKMDECEYNHEGHCVLEMFMKRKDKKHPCKFAKLLDGETVMRTCTATYKDLVDYED